MSTVLGKHAVAGGRRCRLDFNSDTVGNLTVAEGRARRVGAAGWEGAVENRWHNREPLRAAQWRETSTSSSEFVNGGGRKTSTRRETVGRSAAVLAVPRKLRTME
ncbi:hypothetical protein KM043_012719 [Ampulex compressa]|nr:hypothetical protein KM043_012719 [Ampulex compressa]